MITNDYKINKAKITQYKAILKAFKQDEQLYKTLQNNA